MNDLLFKLLGTLLIILGLISLLSLLGANNPLSTASNLLLSLTNQFMSETASLLLWFLILILGLTMIGPKEGYIRKISKR